MADIPFTRTESGKHSGQLTAVEGALTPGDRVAIDGSLDLSKWVVGHGDSCVFGIEMLWDPQWAGQGFILNVDAQGPAGFFSGSLGLRFMSRKEPTEDQYLKEGASAFGEFWLLDILSSTKKQRSKAVRCNEARIEVITWFHRPWYVLPGTGA